VKGEEWEIQRRLFSVMGAMSEPVMRVIVVIKDEKNNT
jgi:hypothetical protein